jgi:hypothetical protein
MHSNTSNQKMFPFIPLGMGILQQEWIDLYYENPERLSSFINSTQPKPIKICFYPRSPQ